MRIIVLTAVAATAAALPNGSLRAQSEHVVADSLRTQYQPLRLTRVASGLEHPWAVSFLPDGRMIVTERPGRLQLIGHGARTQVRGVPAVFARNQGGLLDVAVHPDFERTRWVYLTYSKGDANGTVTALGRGRLEGDSLAGFQELFSANTPAPAGRHYGSRILFLGDGTLLMTLGDRGEPQRAQNTRDHSGSILRLNEDGTVPANNPFIGNAAYAPEIYSYGHRNVQGIARHPGTGEIWITEHGPRGSDELNLVEAGRNYGWPDASLGRDYRTQRQVGERHPVDGKTPPVFEFLPTLAPSGLAAVTSGRFHETWRGNLLAGGLTAERILRLVIENREVVHAEELLLQRVGRVRDVREGPDGAVYVVSDARDGSVYRFEPRN